MIYELPDGPCQYTRTEAFIAYTFPKGRVDPPLMLIKANSPGEAVLKFNRYLEIGQQLGEYECK